MPATLDVVLPSGSTEVPDKTYFTPRKIKRLLSTVVSIDSVMKYALQRFHKCSAVNLKLLLHLEFVSKLCFRLCSLNTAHFYHKLLARFTYGNLIFVPEITSNPG